MNKEFYKNLSIYKFQNHLYVWYQITSIYKRTKNILKIIMPLKANNVLKRAIGEEISDYLKYHKEIIIL